MHFPDAISVFKSLTFRRVCNFIQVHFSFQLRKRWGRAVQPRAPISFSIEPTTSCNLRCPECPSGLRQFSRPTGMLALPHFQSTIDALAPRSIYLTLYFQGEPYLNRNLFEMIAYARAKKLYVATSTNAHYLDDDNARCTVESGLSRLIISIDGTTQESYASYRKGGKLYKVLEGAKNIVKWKKALKSRTPYIIFQFLVVKPNEHQIPEIQALAKEIGVDDVFLKSAQVYDYEQGNDLIPNNVEYSRYIPNGDGTYRLKHKLSDHCWRMWQGCVITWDGSVVPCCFDKDATHSLGNVSSAGFDALWRGSGYAAFRNQVFTARDQIEICKNCTEGATVWV